MVCGISRYRGISRSIVLLLLNIMKPDGSCLEALKVVKTSTAMSVSEILNQFLEKNLYKPRLERFLLSTVCKH